MTHIEICPGPIRARMSNPDCEGELVVATPAAGDSAAEILVYGCRLCGHHVPMSKGIALNTYLPQAGKKLLR